MVIILRIKLDSMLMKAQLLSNKLEKANLWMSAIILGNVVDYDNL